jgi:curved DNA-binding protein CbpA
MADKQTWERKIIEAGYRALAKRKHPDKGGKPEAMAALNQAVTNLRNLVDWVAAARASYDEFSPQPAPPLRYGNPGPFPHGTSGAGGPGRRGARRETPPSPFEGLNEFADKILEIIDKVSKPQGKRRG